MIYCQNNRLYFSLVFAFVSSLLLLTACKYDNKKKQVELIFILCDLSDSITEKNHKGDSSANTERLKNTISSIISDVTKKGHAAELHFLPVSSVISESELTLEPISVLYSNASKQNLQKGKNKRVENELFKKIDSISHVAYNQSCILTSIQHALVSLRIKMKKDTNYNYLPRMIIISDMKEYCNSGIEEGLYITEFSNKKVLEKALISAQKIKRQEEIIHMPNLEIQIVNSSPTMTSLERDNLNILWSQVFQRMGYTNPPKI